MNTIELVKSQHLRAVPSGTDIDGLKEEMDAILKESRELLQAESYLYEAMKDRVNEIRDIVEVADNANKGLATLDLQVLRWRYGLFMKGIPVPKLALVDPFMGNEMKIGDGYANPAPVIGPLRGHYRDVLGACTNKRASITWKFTGAIPSEARELMKREAPNYKHILMLAEAPRDQWAVSRAPKPRRVDPLILGQPHNGSTLVLLGQFDPTPLELYIKSEFTQRQLTA